MDDAYYEVLKWLEQTDPKVIWLVFLLTKMNLLPLLCNFLLIFAEAVVIHVHLYVSLHAHSQPLDHFALNSEKWFCTSQEGFVVLNSLNTIPFPTFCQFDLDLLSLVTTGSLLHGNRFDPSFGFSSLDFYVPCMFMGVAITITLFCILELYPF